MSPMSPLVPGLNGNDTLKDKKEQKMKNLKKF